MGKCDNCRLRKESAKAFDIHWMGTDDCPYDKCPVPDFPKTNADRIRAMSDEELAKWLSNKTECQYCSVRSEWCTESEASCRTNWLDWLRQEATE